MKTLLFFGDSFTSAENNNYESFTNKLEHKLQYSDIIYNFGISGTTIGDYSLYPVGDNHLLAILEQQKAKIEAADIIFLEYGINDISSEIVGYTTANKIQIDLIKCLDFIRQINKNIKIYFVTFDDDNIIWLSYSQCTYLKTDYLKDTFIDIEPETWQFRYKVFRNFINRIFYKNTIEIDVDLDPYISDDKIHPNDDGYQLIATYIENKLKEDNVI